MKKYVLLFGVQYALNNHPVSRHIHPDGWVTVEAPDYNEARYQVIDVFDLAWSDLCSVDDFSDDDKRLFPLGELGVLHVDGTLTMHAVKV